MPVPTAALPATFKPINWGGDACQQMRELLATNERLNILFSWMFTSDGKLNDELLKDMYKWIYGALTSTGVSGGYVINSTPPYSMKYDTLLQGRVAFFIANHTSPAITTGSTLTLDPPAFPAAGTPVALVSRDGNEIDEGEIAIGQLVGVIFDGTKWRTFTQLASPNGPVPPGAEGQTLRTRTIGTKLKSIWETSDYITASGSEVSIPSYGSAATFSHGLTVNSLPVAPGNVSARLVCVTPELGWALGDELALASSWDTDGDRRHQWQIYANKSTIGVLRLHASPDFFQLPNSSGTLSAATEANWKLKVSASI